MIATITQVEQLQNLLCKFASQAIGTGNFTMEKYLKYKSDFRKASSIEKLNLLSKNFMEEVCS